MRASKLISMREALALVPDGARIAPGGFAVYQQPMAVVRELLRQARQGLVGVARGGDADRLANAGRVARCSGVGAVTPTPEQRRKIIRKAAAERRETQRPPCLTPRT